MIPTEIHSYMRSNTFALLFILSCTCGGSFPKPSTTRGYMPTPLQRAAHVALSDNTTSKQHSGKTEIHTSTQSRIQLTCRFSWWQGCLLLSFGSTPARCFFIFARSRWQIRVDNLLFFLAHFTDNRIVSTYAKSHVEECKVGVESCVFRGQWGVFPELHQCFSTQHLTHCCKARKHSSSH